MAKNTNFGSDFGLFSPNLAGWMDGRTDGRTDRLTDGQTDGQTDESDFIGRCPTNVERPKTQK